MLNLHILPIFAIIGVTNITCKHNKGKIFMKLSEEERRARLLKSRAERLPDIRKQFEEAQKRNFNANFAPGGKDAELVGSNRGKGQNGSQGAQNGANGKNGGGKGQKSAKNAKKTAKTAKISKNQAKNIKNAEKTLGAEDRKVNLSVSARKGEMVHHQRMLSQDVNAQATQHIIGVPE